MSHTLQDILSIYKETEGLGYNKIPHELEVKFGTRNIARISYVDYNHVLQKLYSCGFKCSNLSGTTHLKIMFDKNDFNIDDHLRVELLSKSAIQMYCKTNSLDNILDVKYIIKKKAKDKEGNEIRPIDKEDFNLRYTYCCEEVVSTKSENITNVLEHLASIKKIFRYIHRLSFTKEGYPLRIDLSRIKTNKQSGGRLITAYDVKGANLFMNNELFEIEIEVIDYMDNNLLQKIKSTIKLVLSALQQTNYPISYPEQEQIYKDYLDLIGIKDKKKNTKYFIGPSSLTLQYENLSLDNKINVLKDYTVTDKADGIRKLLYIHPSKKIYFIDMNMQIQFTGSVVKTDTFINTILDGEHILHNKEGQYINLFIAFDIYILDNKNVCSKLFIDEGNTLKENMRLYLLMNLVKNIEIIKLGGGNAPFTIRHKKFYSTNDEISIFDACRQVLDNVYDYNTDGLIFTPKLLSVGSNNGEKEFKMEKISWKHSFKWKPSKYNTIDFLVSTKKDKYKKDIISYKFDNGINMEGTNLHQFKHLILRVGYNQSKHGYLNPCQTMLDETWNNINKKVDYRPVPFYPTEPYDNKAHLCDILLQKNSEGHYVMKTDEGDVFEDNMIVEFAYMDGWKPLRIRYDKTEQYKRGEKNYGNAYHVANSNWHSIHHPINEDMLTTGKNIPDPINTIYYNPSMEKSHTRNLRNFHNHSIKKYILSIVAKEKDILIDLAVGKGGDMQKWHLEKLDFVLGIDNSLDNIVNPIDGACARYLNLKKKSKYLFKAIFLKGNSSRNIKNGDAFDNQKNKTIIRAIFGSGSKDSLDKAVARQYAKGMSGFDITSCQFALHYFFENIDILKGFLRNVAECTKKGGYFIGTCYDGEKVFNNLRDKKKGEQIRIYKDDKKIWELTKQYNKDYFLPDVTSLGYPIDVYQESINQSIREYLVNFSFLEKTMLLYGFKLVDNLSIKGIDSFESLWKEQPLSNEEKNISFLNNYFIFQKILDVDIANIEKVVFNNTNIVPKAVKIKKIRLIKKT
tara:strand:+ start:8207 stop:11263 length:3057 start_codon:yes stop_codon:yes gene_type:complete